MTREQILEFLKQNKQEMHDRFGVTKIGLFGSYAEEVHGMIRTLTSLSK
jgi:predicted nucleotidyltransferase